jgi:hypothetical protein
MHTAEIFSVNAKLQSINQLDIQIDVISSIVFMQVVFFVLSYFNYKDRREQIYNHNILFIKVVIFF